MNLLVNKILFTILSLIIVVGAAYLYPLLYKINTSMLVSVIICLGSAAIIGYCLGNLHSLFKNPFQDQFQTVALILSIVFYYLQWSFTLNISPINAWDLCIGIWNYSEQNGYELTSHHGHVKNNISSWLLKAFEVLEFVFLMLFINLMASTGNSKKG